MNPELSKTASTLQPSPTIALNSKAKELKKSGKDVLNFSVGEPDFPTSPEIIHATTEALENNRTKYGPSGGSPELRQAISQKLKTENSLEFSADQIVCGIGAKEILYHLFRAMLDVGDEVIVPAPFWVSYPDQIKAFGGKPVIVPMSDHPQQPVSPDALAAAITPKTKAIVINSPNNPAGFMLDNNTIKAIGDRFRGKPIWVISDEIYEYMAFEHSFQSFLNINPDLSSQTVLVNGLSKGYAMTGFRVGYAAGPAPLINLVKRLISHSSSCLPPFIDAGATLAMEKGRTLMQEKITDLAQRRTFICEKINSEINGLEYINPDGAFYLFIDINRYLKGSKKFATTGTMGFCSWLLEEYFMAVVPGDVFGAPGYIRMSYATSKTDIEKGISRLKQALESLG